MDDKILEKLELNKIFSAVASYAVLSETKREILAEKPCADTNGAEKLLDLTAEADAALFRHGVGRIEAFTPCEDELARAAKGSSLSCGELLAVCGLLAIWQPAAQAPVGKWSILLTFTSPLAG